MNSIKESIFIDKDLAVLLQSVVSPNAFSNGCFC